VQVTKALLIIWVIAINPASPGSGFQTAFLSNDRISDSVISAGFKKPNRATGDLAQPSTHRSNILTIEQTFKIPLDPIYPYFDHTFLTVIQHTQDPFSGFYTYKLTTTERNPFDGRFLAT
jgi:hypothetical protein